MNVKAVNVSSECFYWVDPILFYTRLKGCRFKCNEYFSTNNGCSWRIALIIYWPGRRQNFSVKNRQQASPDPCHPFPQIDILWGLWQCRCFLSFSASHDHRRSSGGTLIELETAEKNSAMDKLLHLIYSGNVVVFFCLLFFYLFFYSNYVFIAGIRSVGPVMTF